MEICHTMYFLFVFLIGHFYPWSIKPFAGCDIFSCITEFKLAFKVCNISQRKFFPNQHKFTISQLNLVKMCEFSSSCVFL